MVKSTISTDILDDSNTKENIVYNNNMPCCASTFIAVKEGHIKCLSTYRPEDLLRVNKSGQSLLHLATYLGNLKVVNFLIGKVPCLIDSRNEIHETPLLIASYCGHINIINKFLDTSHDVAIQRASHKDKNGTTCLMAAISRNDNETSLFLLKRFGKTIASISNNNGMLPLHVAALNGNIEFIRICTKYDQSMVNCKDNYGYTPLIYSIQSGCFLSVKYLVEKAKSDIRIRTPKGQSCLHASCIIGNIQIVKYFLSLLGNDSILEETNDLANCIHCASFHGNIEVLRILAENFKSKRKKEILSLKDSRGNTPLHLAAINDRTAIAKYLVSLKFIN
uniref:ANK_REP_REGION domain-containing protein n=1 Tax=Parastrongyloides trichosuri TaxID=131310 RepID=A0A0N4ZCG8_PARTI